MSEMMMIDAAMLSTVTGGGERGPNQTTVEGEIDVSTPGVTVKGKGKYDAARTDYAACLDAMKGKTPAEIKDTCGLPPAKS